jgi:uncharacterized protein YjgD (DUF1641 family)
MGGKDIIAGKLAESAKMPESAAAIRNGISLARVLASLDPDVLQRMARGLDHASKQQQQEKEAPSMWQLFKRATSADARRGLGFAMHLLTALGKATVKRKD